MKKVLSQNLRQLRKSLGLTQGELSERITISRFTYGQWERNAQKPYPVHLESLADFFSQRFNIAITPDQLREEENLAEHLSAVPSMRNPLFWQELVGGPHIKIDHPALRAAMGAVASAMAEFEQCSARPTEINIVAGNAIVEQLEMDKTKFVPIPLYSDPARVAAGPGTVIDSENIEGYSIIWSDWVRHPEQCITVRVRGDSMYPVLSENSIVCVDFSQADPNTLRDRIVVAKLRDGSVVVKYLRHQATGLLLEPANSNYPTEKLDTERGDVIIGRVIWHWTTD